MNRIFVGLLWVFVGLVACFILDEAEKQAADILCKTCGNGNMIRSQAWLHCPNCHSQQRDLRIPMARCIAVT